MNRNQNCFSALYTHVLISAFEPFSFCLFQPFSSNCFLSEAELKVTKALITSCLYSGVQQFCFQFVIKIYCAVCPHGLRPSRAQLRCCGYSIVLTLGYRKSITISNDWGPPCHWLIRQLFSFHSLCQWIQKVVAVSDNYGECDVDRTEYLNESETGPERLIIFNQCSVLLQFFNSTFYSMLIALNKNSKRIHTLISLWIEKKLRFQGEGKTSQWLFTGYDYVF